MFNRYTWYSISYTNYTGDPENVLINEGADLIWYMKVLNLLLQKQFQPIEHIEHRNVKLGDLLADERSGKLLKGEFKPSFVQFYYIS